MRTHAEFDPVFVTATILLIFAPGITPATSLNALTAPVSSTDVSSSVMLMLPVVMTLVAVPSAVK